MEENALIERKDLRNQLVDRIYVLDKVKELFLIPSLNLMTTNQVADYYEVDAHTIITCYQRNKDEILQDGVEKVAIKNLSAHLVLLERTSYTATFDLGNGKTLKATNAEQNAYSKRAILRIGMLLRDSVIAKEVRTQLLNAIEKTDEKALVADIDEETEIINSIGKAYILGSLEEFAKQSQRYVAFQNRHIEALEMNNKALAKGNLEWSGRAGTNKAIRVMASSLNEPYAVLWKELYNELLYKQHMNLAARGKRPYIQHVKDDEWNQVQLTLASICEDNGLNFSEVIEKAKFLN